VKYCVFFTYAVSHGDSFRSSQLDSDFYFQYLIFVNLKLISQNPVYPNSVLKQPSDDSPYFIRLMADPFIPAGDKDHPIATNAGAPEPAFRQ
jgi:hypothetical protein